MENCCFARPGLIGAPFLIVLCIYLFSNRSGQTLIRPDLLSLNIDCTQEIILENSYVNTLIDYSVQYNNRLMTNIADKVKEKLKDAKDKVANTTKEGAADAKEKMADAKEKMTDAKEQVTGSTKEGASSVSSTAGEQGRKYEEAGTTYQTGKDPTQEYDGKEPMSPAKIKQHEPTAVGRDPSEVNIVESEKQSTNTEDAAEKARRSGMTKGTAGAAETGSEYEQGAAGSNE